MPVIPHDTRDSAHSRGNQEAEPHAGDVEDPLGNYKAHRKEEVGGRQEGEDKEREG